MRRPGMFQSALSAAVFVIAGIAFWGLIIGVLILITN